MWLALAWLGYAILPWYLGAGPSFVAGSALALGVSGEGWWLLPILAALVAASRPLAGGLDRYDTGKWLTAAGIAGLALIMLQGFAIGLNGWNGAWLLALFGGPGPRQGGMGFGAALTSLAFLILLCHGLAMRGWR
jgi:iron(III) transport system permease protein